MSITGSCNCDNIEVTWHVVDYSLVPRACQCDYCLSKGAAYVAKSGTKVDVLIRNENFHKKVWHGSNTAVFHECSNCDELVFVTSDIDGRLYCAMNANQLKNKYGFSAFVSVNYSAQTAEQKRERWRDNWCRLALLTIN